MALYARAQKILAATYNYCFIADRHIGCFCRKHSCSAICVYLVLKTADAQNQNRPNKNSSDHIGRIHCCVFNYKVEVGHYYFTNYWACRTILRFFEQKNRFPLDETQLGTQLNCSKHYPVCNFLFISISGISSLQNHFQKRPLDA